MDLELLNKLKDDPAFVESIKNAKDAKEISEKFTEKGINVTEEQIKFLMENDIEELDEEKLEQVAGGWGIAAGIAVGAFLVACGVGGYLGFRDGLKCK